MKKIIFVFFLITLVSTSFAYTTDSDLITPDKTNLSGKLYILPTGLDGSPYLYEEWSDTDIYLENGKIAKNIKSKLNVITNDLVFYNESLLRVFMIDKEVLKYFVFNPGLKDSSLFIKYKGVEQGFRLKKDYLVEVLHQGEISFILKHFAEVISPNDLTSKKKVYSKKSYFLIANDIPVEIKLRYRSIYKLFPEHKKEIKKIINENKIRRVNKQNMVKLLSIIEVKPEIKNSIRLPK